MKNSVTVTVSGMGTTFDNEFLAIQNALESIGCTVEVRNDYPPPDRISNRVDSHVLLVAKHYPWGS